MKSVQMVPFEAEPKQERVLEMPRSARVVQFIASLEPSPIEMRGPPTARLKFTLVLVADMADAPVPRRFVVVQENEALPDAAEYIDSALLQVGPNALLTLHLFEIPPKLALPTEETEHAQATC